MKSLTFKLDWQWLSIRNLEEQIEMMFPHFFWEVVHTQVHLLTWSKCTSSWLNSEDLLLKDVLFESLFCAWLSRVCPRLHLNFRIIRHFEGPVSIYSTYVLQCKCDSSWFWSILYWHFSEIPRELGEALLHFIVARIYLVRVVEGDFSLT